MTMTSAHGRIAQDGKGWICERAKADFSKLAVEPLGEDPDVDWFSATRTMENHMVLIGQYNIHQLSVIIFEPSCY